MRLCIEVVAESMAAMCSDDYAVLPPRTVVTMPGGRNVLVAMPGATADPSVSGAKLVTVHPDNPARGRAAIQGVILLLDGQDGSPIAVVDAASITALRTAAASAVATRLLARENARNLALLGYGVQARSHLEAMLAVRPISRALVWGRSNQKAAAFAREQAEVFGLPVEAVAEPQEAIREADIVCTVTASTTPILEGNWIRPGTHLNLVGAFAPTSREVDTETIRRARVIVELRETALMEAGELVIPIKEGVLNESHIAGEIGDVILGRVDGRRAAEDITVYKSLGNTSQDLVAAYAVYERCARTGKGVDVRFG